MEPNDWVTVYTVSDPIKAEIIKNALEDEEIPCSIGGANQAGDAGLIGLPIAIQVAAKHAKEAEAFIKSHDSGEKAADGAE